MPVDVTLDKKYKVQSADVFLSLSIGEGQFGTSDIRVEKDLILRASGSIGSLRLGAGGDLKGKTLKALSVINDVSTATNRMSVTYKLTGGSSTAEFTSKGKVTKPGASLVFQATFDLE